MTEIQYKDILGYILKIKSSFKLELIVNFKKAK